MDTTRVAVIGAGVVGLSTAVCISESIPQYSIDVISDKFTPDTTSDVAAGMLMPHAYPDTPVHLQKQWFQETFDRLFAIANSSEAVEAGIQLVSGWQIYRSMPPPERPFWADTVLGFRKMTEAELKKFPQHVFGQAFTTMKCESLSYLPWLEKSCHMPFGKRTSTFESRGRNPKKQPSKWKQQQDNLLFWVEP
ncbi:D-aspartate oxidase isoform X3 [Monodelphis domestica]|uniref:D-aspartate oxidase isoform X3 n=1 Tax=Monodelphis domestica TaxID=13616 RepID=UPI0024E206CA|nr:D-aspartate oxidase isoform X3 [Monodelphis domestica]